ncbi:molybdopterin molybdotransferase MoeA [Thalassotalea profundi]|uniref:Molybdopterin molybdenumtransferase n=1 Tax=Thalassotalea profundi TaxID=2036687 RepID=A0ABQ3IQM6_9GAMM|nr:gephyrin-like molybdotransferase Glp [Thalassotalea profundi]GHE91724.1 molybdopterin molybdenumtransferase MoeA [Thalassotalea profundi]
MTDCCSTPGLMPMNQAKETLLADITPINDIEEVSLNDCDFRICAENMVSPVNVPAHNNSAMDGYALCADFNQDNEIPKGSQFKLVGTAMAGQPFMGELTTGQCIRIMTGAVVPKSATTVEMQENVIVQGESIITNQSISKVNHIRLAGEDIAVGEKVFSQGHKFTSIDIGLLASLGVSSVKVFRKPVIAVFSTGDELKSASDTLSLGDIYESNRHVLIAMLKRLHVEVLDLGIIADDKTKIREAFTIANTKADAVVSSGGVSVGDADYTKEVLNELGSISFWKIAMKPGKPFAFGKLANSIFFGLPGNPVSASVTFHQLAIPAIQKMSGQSLKKPIKLIAKTTDIIKKHPGRMDFQRGTAFTAENNTLNVTPLSHQGSGVLSSMSRANCYIILPQQHQGCNAGEYVEIELFDHIIG